MEKKDQNNIVHNGKEKFCFNLKKFLVKIFFFYFLLKDCVQVKRRKEFSLEKMTFENYEKQRSKQYST